MKEKFRRCLAVCCAGSLFLDAAGLQARDVVALENTKIGLSFDRNSGALTALQNKLTGENYEISGDAFALEAEGCDYPEAKLVSLKHGRERLTARYEAGGTRIEVNYTLRGRDGFFQKRMTLTFDRDCGLKKVILSRMSFAAPGLRIVGYRYPQFGRAPGAEPLCTWFGRTPAGGFFTGMELPFDASTLEGGRIVLGYAPSLKVKAGEKFECEPMYVGVYQRQPADSLPVSPPSPRAENDSLEPAGLKSPAPGDGEVLPLPSESEAMVAMTSAVLGPPRHGLAPMACGWHSEMEQYTYPLDTAVEQDMKSLDFLAGCGVDWLSDSHPWGGETEKMNALRDGQKYEPGPRVRKFLEHARKDGIKVVFWPTMNNTHPWGALGKPFRLDRPEWLMLPGNASNKPDLIKNAKANCLANTPFLEWLTQINMDALATGYYKAWAMDGSFFGDGGWYTTIIPVDCGSDQHDHLPGDSNYGCERALNQLVASVRRKSPDIYVFMCRPAMDLGVWSLRNTDACFTLLETGTGSSNLRAGDSIRGWSRVRVHYHFFPHYLDQPLLFPSRGTGNPKAAPNWPGGHLDYILLSALSSSPNQLYYLPTKTGIPEKDKAEIRSWLVWARKNIEYLQVRKDLPDWPGAGKVDGSAHLAGNRGILFLFNSGKAALPGTFALTGQSIGLKAKGRFKIAQEYPPSSRKVEAHSGETIQWEVPGESAVILKIQPALPE